MSVLMVAVIFGLGFAYLAVQNVGPVSIQLGNFLWAGVPLYAVVLGSFLIGLFVSWILSTVDWLSSAMRIQGKDHEIKETSREVEQLKDRLKIVEIENAKLRGGNQRVVETTRNEVRTDQSSPAKDRPRSMMDKIRNSISQYS